MFDDDETGKISLKNLRRVAKEIGENMTDEELQEMIDEADRDDDGEINEEEYVAHLSWQSCFVLLLSLHETMFPDKVFVFVYFSVWQVSANYEKDIALLDSSVWNIIFFCCVIQNRAKIVSNLNSTTEYGARCINTPR